MDIGAVPRGAWTERWENVMSNNPTPDIRELRRRYVNDKLEGYRAVFGRRPEPYQLDIWADQFDRWLAAHDAELRGELPVQLAETAESDTGWLYDMSDWGPCPSEGNEHVDFRDENGFNIGSIDLHLIAGIAEGADHA